jgi:hypothetical protein
VDISEKLLFPMLESGSEPVEKLGIVIHNVHSPCGGAKREKFTFHRFFKLSTGFPQNY